MKGVSVVRYAPLSRRALLRRTALALLGTGGAALAACAAPPAPTSEPKVVERVVTQVVEKPVEKVVTKEVVVTATAAPAAAAPAAGKGPVTIRYYQFMNSVED